MAESQASQTASRPASQTASRSRKRPRRLGVYTFLAALVLAALLLTLPAGLFTLIQTNDLIESMRPVIEACHNAQGRIAADAPLPDGPDSLGGQDVIARIGGPPASLCTDIQRVREQAGAARNAARAALVLFAAQAALIAFSVSRGLIAPLILAMRNVLTIRRGGEIAETPSSRIRELNVLLWQLPGLNRRLRELSRKSGRLEEEKDKYEILSYVDSLTGIGNRRSFDQQLAGESRDSFLSILMIDVDKFKLYNDSLGHQAGDNALIAVGRAMRQALLRSSDQPFRYGGEEFTVILSGANEDAAMAVAARILVTVRALNILHPSSPVAPMLTVSIGMATRNPGDHMSDDELVARADQALYQAKSTGRNRISVYQETQPERKGEDGARPVSKPSPRTGPIVPARVFEKKRKI